MTKEKPQDVADEQRGVAPAHNDAETERSWRFEMQHQLAAYRRRPSRQTRQSLDINVRMYEVVCSIENGARRGFGKILPAIVANQEMLHPAGRRVLLKVLMKAIKRQRKLAGTAKQRVRHYEAFIAQLDAPKHVAAG
jgi:hypothetical protein